MILSRNLFILILTCITTSSFGETASVVTPNPFAPPPPAQFQMPDYPSLSDMPNPIHFPFFTGEAQWLPPGGTESLFSRYEFPAGSTFQVSPEFTNTEIVPTNYYSGTVTSLPSSYSGYSDFLNSGNFYVQGSELLNQKHQGGGRYTFSRKTTAYQSTPVQNTKTEAQGCETCEKEKEADKQKQNVKQQIGNLNLQVIKTQILKFGQVPQKAFLNAWKYFEDNIDRIRNRDFMTVVDYSKPSDEPRLFVINLKTGSVEKHLVAHGMNSSGTGALSRYAVRYSNANGSKQTSYGAFFTGETYYGTYGFSMKVDPQGHKTLGAALGWILTLPNQLLNAPKMVVFGM